MCRAGGRRCEKHWSEDRVRADRARRRALYASRKAGTVRAYVRADRSVTEASQAFYTNDEAFRSGSCEETSEMFTAIKYSASASVFSTLSEANVKRQEPLDEETVNSVTKVTLDNGEIGYWKGLNQNNDESEIEFVGHTPLSMMNSEVAAYQLAKTLGDDYEKLVPETIIREIDGNVGSLQKEVIGTPYDKWIDDNQDRASIWDGNQDGLDIQSVRAAAIFDYLAGSQDRHDRNIIVTTDSEGRNIPKLIDNGFSFSEGGMFRMNASEFTVASEEEHKPLTDAEEATLQELKDSPDSKGLRNFLTPKAYESFRERLNLILLKGRILESDRHDANMLEFGEWGEGHYPPHYS